MATQEQLQQIQEFFTAMDTNGDGKASIEELATSNNPIILLFTNLVGDGDLESIFARYDSDKDGSLTFEELVAAYEKR